MRAKKFLCPCQNFFESKKFCHNLFRENRLIFDSPEAEPEAETLSEGKPNRLAEILGKREEQSTEAGRELTEPVDEGEPRTETPPPFNFTETEVRGRKELVPKQFKGRIDELTKLSQGGKYFNIDFYDNSGLDILLYFQAPKAKSEGVRKAIDLLKQIVPSNPEVDALAKIKDQVIGFVYVGNHVMGIACMGEIPGELKPNLRWAFTPGKTEKDFPKEQFTKFEQCYTGKQEKDGSWYIVDTFEDKIAAERQKALEHGAATVGAEVATRAPEAEKVTKEYVEKNFDELLKTAGISERDGHLVFMTETPFEGKTIRVERSFKKGAKGKLQKQVLGSIKEDIPKTRACEIMQEKFAEILIGIITSASDKESIKTNRHKVGYKELNIPESTKPDSPEAKRAMELFQASNDVLKKIEAGKAHMPIAGQAAEGGTTAGAGTAATGTESTETSTEASAEASKELVASYDITDTTNPLEKQLKIKYVNGKEETYTVKLPEGFQIKQSEVDGDKYLRIWKGTDAVIYFQINNEGKPAFGPLKNPETGTIYNYACVRIEGTTITVLEEDPEEYSIVPEVGKERTLTIKEAGKEDRTYTVQIPDEYDITVKEDTNGAFKGDKYLEIVPKDSTKDMGSYIEIRIDGTLATHKLKTKAEEIPIEIDEDTHVITIGKVEETEEEAEESGTTEGTAQREDFVGPPEPPEFVGPPEPEESPEVREIKALLAANEALLEEKPKKSVDRVYTLKDPALLDPENVGEFYYMEGYSEVMGILQSRFHVTEPLQVPRILQGIAESFKYTKGMTINYGEEVFRSFLEKTQILERLSQEDTGLFPKQFDTEKYDNKVDYVFDQYKRIQKRLFRAEIDPEGTTPEAVKKDIERLKRLDQLFEDTKTILETIEKAETLPFENSMERYREQVRYTRESQKPDETPPTVKGSFYNFDDLISNKEAIAANKGDLQIALSEAAYADFIRIYHETTGQIYGGNEGNILRTLVKKSYSLDDLFLEKAIFVSQDQTGGTKLVLKDIPESFMQLPREDLGVLMQFIDSPYLATEGSAASLDMPTKEKATEAKILEIRYYLCGSSYEDYLEQKLQAFVQRGVDEMDVLQWSSIDAPAPGTSPTIIETAYKDGYYKSHELLEHTSPRAMIENILSRQKVEIVTHDGKTETLTLWTLEDGSKKINEEALQKYLGYLIKRGFVRQEILKLQKEYDYDLSDYDYEEFETPAQEKINPEGVKRVEAVLLGEPFNVPEERLDATIQELLSTPDKTITVETIFKKLIPEVSDKDYEKLVDEYEDLFEYIAETEETKADPEKKERYDMLKRCFDSSVVLIKRLQSIGVEYASIDSRYEKLMAKSPDLIADISDEHLHYLSQGYIMEVEKDSQVTKLEFFSDDKAIAAMQQTALEAGMPVDDVARMEVVILGAYARIKADPERCCTCVEGGGVFTAIKVSDKFTLLLSAEPNPLDPNATIGFYAQIYQSDTGEEIGAIVTANTSAMGPSVFLGLSAGGDAGNGMKVTGFAGFVGSLLETGAAVGIVAEYDEDQDAMRIFQEDMRASGIELIEKKTDRAEKIAAIKALPLYQPLVSEGYSDEDLLAAVEMVKVAMRIRSFEKASSPIGFTKLGVSAAFTCRGGYIGAVVAFKIGETILFLPQIGERQRIAEAVSARKVSKEMLDAINNLQDPTQRIEFKDLASPEVYMDSMGRRAVRRKDSYLAATAEQIEIREETTRFTKLREELQKAHMDAEIVERTVGGKTGKFLRLAILDTANKNIDVHVDPNSPVKAILTSDGEILLTSEKEGVLEKFAISRETFEYPYEMTKEGATSVDVIVISDIETYKEHQYGTRKDITDQSESILQKLWYKGKSTKWRETRFDTIDRRPQSEEIYSPEEQEKLQGLTLQEYVEKEYKAFPQAEKDRIIAVAKTAGTMQKLFAEREKEVRADITPEMTEKVDKRDKELITLVNAIYPDLKDDLESGKIPIEDPEKVISAVSKKMEGISPLSESEASKVYGLVMHKYFISLWEKGGRKEIERRFKQHNEKIIYKGFQSEFVKILSDAKRRERLQITIPEGQTAESYSKSLCEGLYQSTFEKFKAQMDLIEGIDKMSAKEAAEKLTPTEIPKDLILYIGTTNRETGTVVLAGGILHNNFEGIPQAGFIGELTKADGDLRKLFAEMINPIPSIENPEKTFESPLALKLATFEATGFEIGQENYAKLKEFYTKLRDPAQEKELKAELAKGESGAYYEATTKFIEFAAKVRTALLAGEPKEIPLGSPDSEYKLVLDGSEVVFGSYALCGNATVGMKEDFHMVLPPAITETPEVPVVVTERTTITPKIKYEIRTHEFAVGVTVGVPYKKAPPKRGEKNPAGGRRRPTAEGKVPEGKTMIKTPKGPAVLDRGKGRAGFR